MNILQHHHAGNKKWINKTRVGKLSFLSSVQCTVQYCDPCTTVYRTLQCTTVFSVLQCTVYYRVVYYSLSLLQCTVYYSVHCTTVYIILQCTVYYSVQYTSVQQCTVYYNVQCTIVYSELQCAVYCLLECIQCTLQGFVQYNVRCNVLVPLLHRAMSLDCKFKDTGLVIRNWT